jgi:peptidoglycan/xylan/chitin deacetylase (PgdA/CDA1 family)
LSTQIDDRQATPGTVRDLVGYGPHVPKVTWPDGARLALSLVVNYEEGSEYSFPDGDGRNESVGEIGYHTSSSTRDLANESVYEYGSRAGIWRLFRLFDEYDVKVTIFACAMALEKNPDVGRAIQAAGHEPCSHGWRWEEPWNLTREQEREHIDKAIAAIEATCGERPVGWCCRYGPSIHTRDLLIEEGGFLYDSDAYNDDLPYYTDVAGTSHLVVPYTHTYNDGRFVLTPGYSCPADFVDNVTRGIKALWEEGEERPRMMSVGLHPRIIGQAGRCSALREVIEFAQGLGDVWFARRRDIAGWWAEHGGFVGEEHAGRVG